MNEYKQDDALCQFMIEWIQKQILATPLEPTASVSNHLMSLPIHFLSLVLYTSPAQDTFSAMAASPERKLVEFLHEKQEPFLLDVYLLENGHVRRSMEAEVMTLCWPEKACRKLQKLASRGIRRRRVGFLGSFFSPGKSTDGGDDQLPFPKEWEFLDDPKQHSPVSVLEEQSEGSGDSPTNEQCGKTCSPSGRRPRRKTSLEPLTLQELLMSEMSRKVVSWKPSRWRKHAEELAESSRLLEEETPQIGREWSWRVGEEVQTISAEMEDHVFQNLMQDSIVEFLHLRS